MNQILYTQKSKKGNKLEIKGVIVFFAITVMLFGICLTAQGVYAMFLNKNQEAQNPVEPEIFKPIIDIQRQENEIIVKITHNKPISQITYNWNEEENKTIIVNNKTEITETIELPIGNNILNLSVIDINGEKTEYQKEYIVEGQGKPIVELSITSDNKIKISANDTHGLQHLTYSWNDGEQTKIEPNPETLNIIEKIIEIPLGQNTLKVTATNDAQIQTTKTIDVKGIKKPILTVEQKGAKLYIRAEDEEGMKIVNYTLNGKKYQLNFGTTKVIEYLQDLEEGENTIIIQAYNINDAVTELKGKCVYHP